MIRSTHKTIQDYFQSTAIPSNRELSHTGRAASFESVLQRTLNREAPAGQNESTGLSVRDYMDRRLDATVSRDAIPLTTGQNPSQGASGQNTEVLPNTKADPASEKTPAAAILQTVSAKAERQTIQHAIQQAAERYNVPSDLIHSVIRCESNFKPDALSRAGAQGLMQLMPATAGDLGVTDPFDIQQNIDGGTRYLRQMLDRFNGDTKNALAAYNAGPGTVSRYGGVPPYRETQAYVEKVMRYTERSKPTGIV